MKKLFLSLMSAAAIGLSAQAQTARVMAIHNSADPAVDTVDVYVLVNGSQATKVENLGFRQSTGFITLPSGVPVRLAFAPKTSTTLADTLVGFGYTLDANQTYVLMAQGHVASGFTPQKPFELAVITPAFERNASGGDSTILNIVHGSTDAPGVDIEVRGPQNFLLAVNDLQYGQNTGYVKIKEDNYFVDIYAAGADNALVTFGAPLKTLNLGDTALVVFASGFLNPSANKNGPSFGIFVANASGTVLPLPVESTFKLQAFHNCADPIADTVDVWLINRTTNVNLRAIPNFAFRTATPFLTLPANQELALGITLPGAPLADTVYVEDIGSIGGGFVALGVATGVLDESKFESNPNGNSIGFEITGIGALTQAISAGLVSLQVYHGSTDAPAVDVRGRIGGPLFEALEYGDFGPDYLSVPAQDFTIDITAAGSTTPLVSYVAPLSGFADSALVVVASGFYSPNVPQGLDMGAGFELIAVTAGGRTISLPVFNSVASVSANVIGVSVYPNPATDLVNISLPVNNTTAYKVTLLDITGRAVWTEETTRSIKINTSNWDKGVYMISLESANQTAYQKVLLK